MEWGFEKKVVRLSFEGVFPSLVKIKSGCIWPELSLKPGIWFGKFSLPFAVNSYKVVFSNHSFLRFQWNCWNSPNTTVTDDLGTGERKKVRETFYRRFQRVKEEEEDTMLCWNIQRKRLLTQVKAPRELILVFIRHRRKSTEQDQNERRPIDFEGRLSICFEDFDYCNT